MNDFDLLGNFFFFGRNGFVVLYKLYIWSILNILQFLSNRCKPNNKTAHSGWIEMFQDILATIFSVAKMTRSVFNHSSNELELECRTAVISQKHVTDSTILKPKYSENVQLYHPVACFFHSHNKKHFSFQIRKSWEFLYKTYQHLKRVPCSIGPGHHAENTWKSKERDISLLKLYW